MMKKIKSSKGFTLIELLVVIAIIGILSSVVLASLNTARQKARDSKRVADLKQIQLALELYFDGNGNGTYPADIAELDDAANKYIPAVPTDPQGGGVYAYCLDAATTRRSYHLGAVLERADEVVLGSDADAASTVCAAGGFSGLAVTGTDTCGGAAGSAYPNPTTPEVCYDLVP